MDHNSRFLFKAFRRYYMNESPIMPDRFTKREFGFFFFDKQMVQRHIGFTSPDLLRTFLISNVPSHSYYSTAYYRYPTKPVMDEKEWLGAELIFDLDADHLEGADKMTYSDMMLRIRSEMMHLVDDFLCSDLGFSADQIKLNFSGGRGYHAHVPATEVLGLGTHERRELVDYITCTGLNMDWVFPFKQVATSQYKSGDLSRTNVSQYRTIPSEDDGGWKHKMRNGLKDVIADFCTMETKDIRKKYSGAKASQNATVSKVQEDIRKAGNSIFTNNSMVNLTKTSQEMLVRIMGEDMAPLMSGEVDKPVTPDIKRIIRLPGSVHGKTGLRVTPITRDELTNFDPLQFAVPKTYTDEPVRITMRKDMQLDMLGQHFSLKGETEVPEYVAVFLIGRKYADHGFLSERTDSLF